MNVKRIAIIPARGGSKRIPKKNLIDFMGKPLIAWTIEAAIESKAFSKVVVSTDDEEIAKVSRKYGAEVPFLRDAFADDHSPVSQGTIHTLAQLESSGEFFREVVQLFAVCPLRTSSDILEAINFFEERKLNFLISSYKYTWMNPWWATTIDVSGKPNWIFKDSLKRSQDLPELYSPTGAIWIANVNQLKEAQSFYGPGHVFWKMNWKRAIDIDTYEDVELAEIFFEFEKSKK